eukprot:TRINITY_DN32696_c0_g1_i1.p1 TRINITY_DN32696_c0_g1~~TRINITY_DN32696_c0_g1_i1.p1  ORF type:complete len:261 (-),score=3.42 TRINITY_DN32696_c0_g1_i1:162-944(-)
MGSIHSGGTADMNLFELGEKHYAIRPEVWRSYGITTWLRYRDDVFLVGDTTLGIYRFPLNFRQRISSCYTATTEAVSRKTVRMLDMEVYKHTSDGVARLRVRPFFKNTNSVPLSFLSSHAPGVHSWPMSEVRRVAKLSSTVEDFEHARSTLCWRFSNSLFPIEFVQRMFAYNPWHEVRRGRRTLSSITKADSSALDSSPTEVASRFTVTLVLPYHPVLYSAHVQRFVERFVEQHSQILLGRDVKIRVAWRNDARPVILLL